MTDDHVTSSAVVGGLAAVAASLLLLRRPAAARLDAAASRVLARDHGPNVDRVVGAATDLGSVYAITGSALTLAAVGERGLALDVAAAGMAAWTVAQAAKGPVRRPRPYQADGVRRLVAEPSGTSWPSGHAAVGGAIATAVWPVTPSARRPVVAALPVMVAASRVHVGVHYLTDVVAGVGLGVASGALAIAARRRAR